MQSPTTPGQGTTHLHSLGPSPTTAHTHAHSHSHSHSHAHVHAHAHAHAHTHSRGFKRSAAASTDDEGDNEGDTRPSSSSRRNTAVKRACNECRQQKVSLPFVGFQPSVANGR